ncbi:Fe-S oxidoreductase [Microbacterium sp. C7(2022)]|uniref:Fe-S oxidoreductase n=1 Tax=Microbacterium sp. C7(2022) TaxID=2992759 RepID=UPI00237B2E2C|nr:Fe-S oxidoreductase [Microbacterium sp. C7(2022)]MDE0547248.1 Fe-S oxidoreductase [Microbacterium sp. C7(2022)]
MTRTAPPPDWRETADLMLERGRRVDALIPRVLLDSPISRVGYWYGTAVGWVWGTVWSTGRIEKMNGLWVFRGMPDWSYPRGGVCAGGCYLTGDVTPSATVLRHEAIHKRQWEKYGFLMPILYRFAGRNPLRNRFEIEAGLEDGNYVPRRRAQRRVESP